MIALAAYTYIQQEDESLGVLAIMAFLLFRYFDDKTDTKI